MPSVKPGVVTGAAYRDLVAACKQDGYALPAVNITSSSTMNAALEAAANAGSDIIIQLSNGGAQFFAGKGIKDADAARVVGAVSAARHAQLMAEYYGVAVVMHTDHANRKFVPWVDEMLKWSEKAYAETGKALYSPHMRDTDRRVTRRQHVNPCGLPDAYGSHRNEPGYRTGWSRWRGRRYR